MDLTPQGAPQESDVAGGQEPIAPSPLQPPAQKRNNTWLVILILVLLVICCICVLLIAGVIIWLGPVSGSVFSNIMEVNPVYP